MGRVCKKVTRSKRGSYSRARKSVKRSVDRWMANLERLERQGQMGKRQKILEREYAQYIKRGGRLRGGASQIGDLNDDLNGGGDASCACGADDSNANGANNGIDGAAIFAGQVPRSVVPFRGQTMQPVVYAPSNENYLRRSLAMGSASAMTDRLRAERLRVLDAEAMAKYGRPFSKLSSVQQKYFANNTDRIQSYIRAGQLVSQLSETN